MIACVSQSRRWGRPFEWLRRCGRGGEGRGADIYICMYVCMYVDIHRYVCRYVGMYRYVCMYVCTYVRTYVCMYVCIHYMYIYGCAAAAERTVRSGSAERSGRACGTRAKPGCCFTLCGIRWIRLSVYLIDQPADRWRPAAAPRPEQHGCVAMQHVASRGARRRKRADGLGSGRSMSGPRLISVGVRTCE